ncbi:MAG: hypothetical protein NVSMB15_12570 [Steroidobacteraceae bacterium]
MPWLRPIIRGVELRAAGAPPLPRLNVQGEARRPFLGAAASIEEIRRIELRVLPALDRWIAARGLSAK